MYQFLGLLVFGLCFGSVLPAAHAQGRDDERYGPALGSSLGPSEPVAPSQIEPLPEGPAQRQPPPGTRAERVYVEREPARPDVQRPFQGSSPIAQRWRVGLDLALLDYSSLTFTPSGVGALSATRSTINFGLSQSAGLGIGGGYGLTDHLVLNGRVFLQGGSTSVDGGASTSQHSIGLFPSIAYVFDDARATLRPFVGGMLGFQSGSIPLGVGDATEFSVLIAAHAGLHVFANEHVSFDPALQIGYRIGSASTDAPSVDFSMHGFVLLITAGISYWS